MHKLLFSVLFCFTLSATAQRIDMQFGTALPGGSFGNDDIHKSDNAFAVKGYALSLQADYHIYKNIGIIAKLNFSSFGFNRSSYQTQLNQNPASVSSVSVESNGGYNSTSAMAGAFMALGKKKLTVDFRLMTGFLTLMDNGLTYTTVYAGQEYKQRIFSEKDATLAFGWGVTARYTFSSKVYLSLNMDNLYANTTFNQNEYQSSSEETIDKPFQAYLLSLGLGYTFQ